jgi:hypothetical protein
MRRRKIGLLKNWATEILDDGIFGDGTFRRLSLVVE